MRVRERGKEDLMSFLKAKIGRCPSVWWNGELVSLGEALCRADELMPSEQALCSHDEVLVPRQLEQETGVANSSPPAN
jgi:hypothetical protein